MRLFAFQLIAALVVICVGAKPAMAQLLSHISNTIGSVNAPGVGQSFTAPSNTDLTRISVRPGAPFTGNLHIYNTANGSGTFGVVGAPTYSQTGVNLTATTDGGPLQDVVLTTPFPLTAGQPYTFVFEGTGSFYANSANPYAAGEALTHYSDTFLVPNYDLAFQLWGPSPPAPASIPTVSEWGLILMSCALTLFGFGRMRSLRSH